MTTTTTKTETPPEVVVPAEQPTAIAKTNEPKTFRAKAILIALDCLSDMVGEERAKEAAGRVATALAVSESSASDPKAFQSCT